MAKYKLAWILTFKSICDREIANYAAANITIHGSLLYT